MRIILVYHAISKYDAIAVDLLQEYQSLKNLGHDVFIYAEKFDKEYRRLIIDERLFTTMAKNKDAIVILHHGGYWQRGSVFLENISAVIVLKYHNVTPPDFFQDYNSDFYNYSLLGKKQTRDYAESGKIALFVADSNYNASELKQYGVSDEKLAVVPPFHKIDEFERIQPDIRVLDGLLDGKVNLLFVGRVAPNKGHKHLIHTMEKYVQYYGYDVRMNIIGGIDPKLTSYFNELTDYVNNAGLNDVIDFKKHVSLSDLFSFYIGSHLFLLLSEHEGFCVPILEAQYHHVPIIALNRGAIKETLGDEQVVFDDVDYDVLAAAVHTVASSRNIRSFLAAKGRENYLNYTTPKLETKFIDTIHDKI